jgi:hypothetical protein
VRNGDSLASAAHTELVEDVLHMRADGLGADELPFGDVERREAVREKLKDLELPTGEPGGGSGDGWARLPHEPAHPGKQLVGGVGLHDVVVGADNQAGHSIVRLRTRAGRERSGNSSPRFLCLPEEASAMLRRCKELAGNFVSRYFRR